MPTHHALAAAVLATLSFAAAAQTGGQLQTITVYDDVVQENPILKGFSRFDLERIGGRYEAAAYVRNITHQIRVVGGIDFNNRTGFSNEPRSFGASFKAMF